MAKPELIELDTRELLSLSASVVDELRSRGVVRSSNNPLGDYAESLVARALSLELLRKSNAGCDARDSLGARYEVKARRVTKHNPSTQLSPMRNLELRRFDFLVGVLFDGDYSVARACLVSHEFIKRSAVFRKHVNGWVLSLRSSLWEQEGVEDITERLRKAQTEAPVKLQTVT